MNSQDDSTQDYKSSLLVSMELIKIIVPLAFVASIIYLISSHSDCWFSISCHPDSDVTGYELSTILVGFLTTVALTSVFSAPIAPAAVVGILAWLALRFWL